jgi:aminopeptidase N
MNIWGKKDISLSFDIPQRTLDATIVHSFKNTRSHAVTLGPEGLSLNGIGFLDLSVTGCDDFDYDGKVIRVYWANRTWSPGETRPVTLTYKVCRPVAGMYFDVPSAAYPNRSLHAITDHETERARYWLACVDFPASRSTLRFEIEALNGFKAIANGALVSEAPSVKKEGYTTTVYECKTPCPSYLICVAVGDFVSVQDTTTAQGVPMTYFGPAKSLTAEDLSRSFGRTPKMMDWIVGKLGIAFPWPKYFQIGNYCLLLDQSRA